MAFLDHTVIKHHDGTGYSRGIAARATLAELFAPWRNLFTHSRYTVYDLSKNQSPYIRHKPVNHYSPAQKLGWFLLGLVTLPFTLLIGVIFQACAPHFRYPNSANTKYNYAGMDEDSLPGPEDDDCLEEEYQPQFKNEDNRKANLTRDFDINALDSEDEDEDDALSFGSDNDAQLSSVWRQEWRPVAEQPADELSSVHRQEWRPVNNDRPITPSDQFDVVGSFLPQRQAGQQRSSRVSGSDDRGLAQPVQRALYSPLSFRD